VIVSINQPAYLPWLGYFHRVQASDVHVVLDHVQFEKNSFVNRNKVRIPTGWTWLTVPVLTAGRFGALPIREVEIDDRTGWRRKHARTLAQHYGRAPFFDHHAAFFESLYSRSWQLLNELCDETMRYLSDALGITTTVVRSSELSARGVKDELVLGICRELGAQTYLSGPLGRNYIREELFEEAGIRLAYQDYRHPEYPQLHAPPFEPYMAIVDLLFNCGPSSLEVIMSGQEALV
jgi:hypothetical protein